MKKSLTLPLFLFALVVLLSNFSMDRVSSFVMTVVNESPILPSTPFEYDDIDIPAHLLRSPDTTSIGYEVGGPIDTTLLRAVENDAATLGRVLFYDKKLSAMENISCGSCHDQSLSFTENKAFSEGILADTKRNSMNLNDLGWSNLEHFAWDMRKKDLHEMIILPLTDENEIGANIDDIELKLSESTYYPELFANAFGDSQITGDRIVEALVQFINSMTTFNSRFDEQAKNDFADFNDEELHGMEMFSVFCAFCHSQGSHNPFGEIIFPEDEDILQFFPFIFNNGLTPSPDDKGAGEWLDGFDDLFKIPTLRNIELTAPYMHDGRFTTLEEVVEHYSTGIESNEWSDFLLPPGGFQFFEEEKRALVAFLKTLTDKTFLVDEKWSDPFASSSLERPELEDLVLKPNPMSDRAVIEFRNDNQQLVSVNVLSSDGKLIRHDQLDGNQYFMEKEQFDSGMYFIELIMDDRRSIQKLIVK